MARTNATFKLSKSVKLVLATIDDPHERGAYKKAMIDAQASHTDSKNRKFTELRSKPTGNSKSK